MDRIPAPRWFLFFLSLLSLCKHWHIQGKCLRSLSICLCHRGSEVQIQRLTLPVGCGLREEIGWLQLLEEWWVNSQGGTGLLLSDLPGTNFSPNLTPFLAALPAHANRSWQGSSVFLLSFSSSAKSAYLIKIFCNTASQPLRINVNPTKSQRWKQLLTIRKGGGIQTAALTAQSGRWEPCVPNVVTSWPPNAFLLEASKATCCLTVAGGAG